MSARALGVAAVLAVALAAPAAAQDVAPVIDVELPVLDLDLPTANADQSVRVRADRVTLAADVLFAFDSASLSPRGRSRVRAAAAEIRRRDPRTVVVEGHTDDKGGEAYNLTLSRRRAQAVRRALRDELGRRGPALRAVGRGEAEPEVRNTTSSGADDPRGRARNRRVEVLLPRR